METFLRREDAERFVAEVRVDELELALHLRIEERELEPGGLNKQGSISASDYETLTQIAYAWAFLAEAVPLYT